MNKRGKRGKKKPSTLERMLQKQVQVITGDGRVFVGVLRGMDQIMNTVLENCKERVFSSKKPVKEIKLGLYMIRGELICMIGELDIEAEKNMDFEGIIAKPIPPLRMK